MNFSTMKWISTGASFLNAATGHPVMSLLWAGLGVVCHAGQQKEKRSQEALNRAILRLNQK